jgi:3-hydroxyisobutyrate dehydrogenase-like beta-hydroxyacid dehydrogenase
MSAVTDATGTHEPAASTFSLAGRRPVIGVLHPGAMGAAIGVALRPLAGQVIWAEAGRSDATAKRAEIADLVAVPTLADLVRRSDMVVSICPPHAAVAVAEAVAQVGAPPEIYLDANAVAPVTARRVGDLLGADRVVDGAIIGGPAYDRAAGTKLWLSGERASAVAELFASSAFATGVLAGPIGQASAVKACFALRSKALPAIWMQIAALAEHHGVLDDVTAELARDDTDLMAELASIVRRATPKAWRWAGEMDEAALAAAEAGLPTGFSAAAGEIYRRFADLAGDADPSRSSVPGQRWRNLRRPSTGA